MEDIIQKLHIKYNLPIGAIRAIVDSVFRCTAEEIRTNKQKSFGYMNLGKLVFNQKYWDKVQSIKRKKEQDLKELNEQDPGNFKWLGESDNQR